MLNDILYLNIFHTCLHFQFISLHAWAFLFERCIHFLVNSIDIRDLRYIHFLMSGVNIRSKLCFSKVHESVYCICDSYSLKLTWHPSDVTYFKLKVWCSYCRDIQKIKSFPKWTFFKRTIYFCETQMRNKWKWTLPENNIWALAWQNLSLGFRTKWD